MTMETLAERAALMRESLQKSQIITENMATILGSFDQRLSTLEAAMRPTQARTHSIRKAHENIDKAMKSANVILAQFDLSRKIREVHMAKSSRVEKEKVAAHNREN